MKGIYDYIVIGAGSAGCVLANRLTSDRSNRLLLLEAGGTDLSPYIHIPAGLMLLQQKFDWRYEAEPDGSRNGAVDKWAAGKVLGGSSSINGMLWVRGHRADFDGWSNAGCQGWDYDSVLPYFVRAETYERPAGPYRGAHGPQHVSHVRSIHPLTEAFIEAAVERGHPFNPDYNGASQEGVAYAQVSQRGGLRHSTARAYLLPARRRRNLSVTTRAQVSRIVVEHGRAVAVDYQVDGHAHTARAGEVILAAGALASPKLLMLSGIGPASLLTRLGIPVVVDSRSVGQNLQEHPYAMMSWHVNVPTLNVEIKPRDFLRHGAAYVLRREGPGASPVTHAVLFTHAEGGGDPSDVQGSFSPIAFGSPAPNATIRQRGGGRAVHDVHDLQLHDLPAVNLLPCVLHPEGRGQVAIRSAQPSDPIRIEHELVGRRRDLDRLFGAARILRDIMSAPAMARHVIDERLPGPQVQSDDEWRQWLHAASWRGEHPVGTCRMGSDDEAVVDPELRVHGIEGLRVADASIFPTLTSGNTNAPVVMVGEKASDLVLGRTTDLV